MTTLRATTALAAEIARIDRQRLNEAIAAGFYPCAPETVAGRARSFGVNDLLALRVYGHLLLDGVTPRHAGHSACQLLGFLEEFPDTDHVLEVVADFGTIRGPVSWIRPETFAQAGGVISGRAIIYVRDWYLLPMREAILRRLHEEAQVRIVGSADGED